MSEWPKNNGAREQKDEEYQGAPEEALEEAAHEPDEKIARLFPSPAFRVIDSHGVVHSAESKDDVARMNQDEREAA
jgi:hypothetical protein